jgi:hypothetical protein
MDNLFTGAGLLLLLDRLHNFKNMRMHLKCTGVVRKSLRGVPECVKMEEETTVEGIRQAKGKLNVAVLKSTAAASFDWPEIICATVYDNKPLNIMTTDHTSVQWKLMSRDVWCSNEKKFVPLSHYRLAVIDDYNMEMNGGDIADQLVKNYDPRGSLRERFWWRVVEGMIEDRCYVNAFLLYTRQCQLENVTPMTHYRFLSETYQAMIKDALPPKPARPLPLALAGGTPSPASPHTPVSLKRTRGQQQRAESVLPPRPYKKTAVTATRKNVAVRLDRDLDHQPKEQKRKSPLCQVHEYHNTKIGGKAQQSKKCVMWCEGCQVHICLGCFSPHHNLAELPNPNKQ